MDREKSLKWKEVKSFAEEKTFWKEKEMQKFHHLAQTSALVNRNE